MTHSITQLITMPEGKTLEFKRDLSSPKNMLKTLVAFANTAGGRLYSVQFLNKIICFRDAGYCIVVYSTLGTFEVTAM